MAVSTSGNASTARHRLSYVNNLRAMVIFFVVVYRLGVTYSGYENGIQTNSGEFGPDE